MFTTAGRTFATSVAMSGVPGSTGGVAKGAGVCGSGVRRGRGRRGVLAAGPGREGSQRGSAVRGMSFRRVMTPVQQARRADSRLRRRFSPSFRARLRSAFVGRVDHLAQPRLLVRPRPRARPRRRRPRSRGRRSASASRRRPRLDVDVPAQRHELAVEPLRLAGRRRSRPATPRPRAVGDRLLARGRARAPRAARRGARFSSGAARCRSGRSERATDRQRRRAARRTTSGTTPSAMGMPVSDRSACGTRSKRCDTRSSVSPLLDRPEAHEQVERVEARDREVGADRVARERRQRLRQACPTPGAGGRRVAHSASAVFRMRREAVEDAPVLADADVAVVVEHQPGHQRVGLLARQARHAHHVGEADAALLRADAPRGAPLRLARVLRRRRGPEEEAVHLLVEGRLRPRAARGARAGRRRLATPRRSRSRHSRTRENGDNGWNVQKRASPTTRRNT